MRRAAGIRRRPRPAAPTGPVDEQRWCDASIGVRRGSLQLDADIRVGRGEVLAVVGPNGSGKTTALGVLSGLLAVDRGRVALGGRVLDDPTTDTFVGPERRGVGVVFQDPLLFPNLDLRDNVAFGLQARGIRRDVARARSMQWVERVGLGTVAAARPDEVSGGQAQRAALARALVTEPGLLLLDEPFSALDTATRVSLRRDLRDHLDAYGGATVLVTHDVVDAFALADRIVVLEKGAVTQTGSVAEVTRSPRTPYVAGLTGTNLLAGSAAGHRITLDAAGDGRRAQVVVAESHDGPVLVVIRPSSVTLQVEQPTGSPRNRWPMLVAGLDPLGERVRVRLSGPLDLVAEVTAASIVEMDLAIGTRVWAAVKATDVVVQDR